MIWRITSNGLYDVIGYDLYLFMIALLTHCCSMYGVYLPTLTYEISQMYRQYTIHGVYGQNNDQLMDKTQIIYTHQLFMVIIVVIITSPHINKPHVV